MTDIRPGGLVRETLDATAGQLLIGGVVREALVRAGTALEVAGVVREALLVSPLITGPRQYAVTVTT